MSHLSLSIRHFSTQTSILSSGIFRSFNARVGLLFLFGILALSTLSWAHELYIQFILVVWNIAVVLFIIFWEKEKTRRQAGLPDHTKDERWSKTKREIESIDSKLPKTHDSEKKKDLLARRMYLMNELRRLEWSIKESNINEMYNAQQGGLKKLDPSSQQKGPIGGRKLLDPEEIDEEVERSKKKELEYLNGFEKSLESILKDEPIDSLPAVLGPLINEIRAHYNMLKQRNPSSGSLTNCWTIWALGSTLVEGGRVNPGLSKYATKQFKPKIDSLMTILVKRELVAREGDAQLNRLDLESV